MLGIVGSFSPQFYKKIVSQPLAKSFGFLIVFIVIISALVSFQLTVAVKSLLPQASSWVNDNFENIIADLPDIEISEGELILPAAAYMREWDIEDEGRFAVIIDPAIIDYYSIIERYANVLVLAKRQLIIKSSKSEVEQQIKTYRLDNITSFKIFRVTSGLAVTVGDNTFNVTPASIKRFLEKISLYVYPAALVFSTLFYSFSKILQLLLFSILSLIFNSSLKAQLDYGQLINIGIYALVPGTILAIGQKLSGIFIPFYGLLYCAVYVAYLYFGIKSCRQGPVTVTGM